MQWLRLFHIVSISIWFGSVVCIGALAIVSGTAAVKYKYQFCKPFFHGVTPSIDFIFETLLLASIGTFPLPRLSSMSVDTSSLLVLL